MLNSSAVMLKSRAIIVNKFSENGKLIIIIIIIKKVKIHTDEEP